MKLCRKCGRTRPRSEFHKNGRRRDGLQTQCKECRSKHDRSRYRTDPERRREIARNRQASLKRNREYVRDYLLENPCVDCGETDPLVLDFDHVRGEKLIEVSTLRAASLERVDSEIAKCEVRCGNCHRRKTAREGRWWIHEMTRGMFPD